MHGWTEYLQFSLPATLMIVASTWTLCALALMAAEIGELELGSFTVCLHVVNMMLMFPTGMA